MGDQNGGRAGARAIALIGPFASGKTTLLEAILERCGAVPAAGTVADGTSVGDGSPEARAHRMGVELNIATCRYLGDTYTFLDCPGSVEFLFEAEPVIAAVDLAVVVCEADDKKLHALQPVMRALEARGVPRVLFLNKIDKADRSVRETLALMQPASAAPLVLRQIPIWKEGIAVGFVDLALERAHIYREHSESEVIDIPSEEKAREVEARFSMLERLADYDDELMEQLLGDIEPPRDRVFQDLISEMRRGLICPVFLGSALRGNGVTRLLKALRHEAPGIAETRARLALPATTDAVLQVMKTIHTQHGGKQSLVRVLSGRIADGAVLYRDGAEAGRVSGVLALTGRDSAKLGEAKEGDTVAVAKVDGARTGDTLTTRKGGIKPLVTLTPPEPVMALALVSADRKDEVKISSALARIVEEDPSLSVRHQPDTGETLIEGQGEMHLRVAVERLAGRYGVRVSTRPPAVPYKETIRGRTSVRGRHKKQSGGHGQFGDVVLEISPQPRGAGFLFTEAITGGVVPRNYIPAVEEGVQDYLAAGPLGFPVVDVAVRLVDGSYHTVDSSDQAFKTAAQIGMREGMPQCQPVLLEPVLRVEFRAPSEFTARVNQIVTGRRGQLLGFDAHPSMPGWDVVQALIPEAEMRNLVVELRSATAGVGTFTARFDHLAELTGHLAAKVLESHKAHAA